MTQPTTVARTTPAAGAERRDRHPRDASRSPTAPIATMTNDTTSKKCDVRRSRYGYLRRRPAAAISIHRNGTAIASARALSSAKPQSPPGTAG